VTVLVVDDHATFRQTAAKLLEFLGHQTVEARDEEEAKAALDQSADIELVLIDMNLGGAHGLSLAGSLEAARPGLRVLFMSGYGQEALDVPELAGPRRHYIEKPFSLATLSAAMSELLARP
jgi:DNA-binding NtrC family response regulator